MRFQTGFEAFDPYVVIGHSPDVSPETTEEEQEFKRARGQTRSTSAKQAVALTEPFNPSVYASHETHPDALASYADGLRAESPFLKYEQFYKVIEYFFEGEQKGKREVDDNEVNAYVSNANPILAATIGNFADLHDLRIRAIHMKPQAKRLKDKTHLSPNSFQHIQEIVMALPKLQDLARLLLKNPPRNTG